MDRKAFIKSCRRQGYKYVEIAKLLGVSRQRVEQILRPNKQKARAAVQKAGLTKKLWPCEYPGCFELKTQAHHFDYNQHLKVNWLCVKHHKEFHSKDKVEIKIRKCVSCGIEVEKRYKRCKDCNRKHLNRSRRKIWKTNPIFREKQKQATKNWQKNNPERKKELDKRAYKRYYEKHKEEINFKQREKRRLKKLST